MITSKDIMLCQSITESEALALKQENYSANRKMDGERILAVIEKFQDTPLTPFQEDIIVSKSVILLNRRGSCVNKNFREVVKDLEAFSKRLKDSEVIILDGEIISIDDNFNKLQRRALTKDTNKIKALEKEVPVKYMVFDILNRGDKNVMLEPLYIRIQELQKIYTEITQNQPIKNIELVEYGSITAILEKAKEEKREGIVVKDLQGIYEGRRSQYWKKLKFWNEVDVVFTKYTINNMGIRVETDDGKIACQVAGEQSQEVRDLMDKDGKAELTIQYLSKNEETGGYRFPSYKKVVIK
jgi:hypothetical protein